MSRFRSTDFSWPVAALAVMTAAVFAFVTVAPSADAQSSGAGVYANQQKPSMGEVMEAAMQPLEADPEGRYVASSAGVTPLDVIASADLATDQQTVRYTQEITLENLGSAGSVCLCSTTWALTCAAATCSCRTSATSKPIIAAPGKSVKARYAGTRRVCAGASAAAVEYQVGRTIKKVGDR